MTKLLFFDIVKKNNPGVAPMNEKCLSADLHSLPPPLSVVVESLKRLPRRRECGVYEKTQLLLPGEGADRAHILDLSA
ncbi:MAG: hypothetical protein Q8R36_04030 [bacterium]|nr:hypothetical protein [bacterium]